jgi:hypothetical protein
VVAHNTDDNGAVEVAYNIRVAGVLVAEGHRNEVVAHNTDDNGAVEVAYNIRVVGVLVEVGHYNEVVVVVVVDGYMLLVDLV